MLEQLWSSEAPEQLNTPALCTEEAFTRHAREGSLPSERVGGSGRDNGCPFQVYDLISPSLDPEHLPSLPSFSSFQFNSPFSPQDNFFHANIHNEIHAEAKVFLLVFFSPRGTQSELSPSCFQNWKCLFRGRYISRGSPAERCLDYPLWWATPFRLLCLEVKK